MARSRRESRGGKSSRRGNVLSINWKDANINSRIKEEGDYLFKIIKAEKTESQNGDDQVELTVECLDEENAGAQMKVWFSLLPQALWKLAELMDAIGMDIPEDEEDLDLDEFIDQEFIGTVEEHSYRGKDSLRVQQFAPVEEKKDDKKSDKKEDKKEDKKGDKKDGRSSRSERRREKEKDLPKLTINEVEDMNEDELDDLVSKYDLDVSLEDAKTLRKKAALVLDELEAKDLIEEEKKDDRRRR